MSTVLEVCYFNSFLLKKAPGFGIPASGGVADNNGSVWPSLPWQPDGYPSFPTNSTTDSAAPPEFAWYVEESRIRGGFNNISTELGPRAYAAEEIDNQQVLGSSIIYSGIFNSTTQFNETNVFSVGENITKNIDPRYGTIQYMFASDTNLDIFQENKVSRALIDKDAIYSASGGGTVTSSNLVIGQITPYVGDYGISKQPQSFAFFGFRRYFADTYRGKIMRLSRDGLTEISEYGMNDFFRDELGNLSDEWVTKRVTVTINPEGDSNGYTYKIIGADIGDVELGMTLENFFNGPTVINLEEDATSPAGILVTFDTLTFPDTSEEVSFFKFVKDTVVAGYDNYADTYVLSIQPVDTTGTDENYYTLSYDEQVRGWPSFYSYKPELVESLKNRYYTFKDGIVYLHNDENVPRNNFYGTTYDSSIEFIFNLSPSVVKNFQTISYEGSNGWEIAKFDSSETGYDNFNSTYQLTNDQTSSVKSYDEGLYIDSISGYPMRAGFDRKENLYVANLINKSTAAPGEVIYGAKISGIRGYFATVTIKNDATTDYGGTKELFAVGTKFVKSS
tara:strand:- start:185 stop:1870 length:1686 start_codon:yes stop_codon:yes gene_type:complete